MSNPAAGSGSQNGTNITKHAITLLSALHAADAPKPASAEPAAQTPRGLPVEADGTLTLAGKPFYGIGL